MIRLTVLLLFVLLVQPAVAQVVRAPTLSSDRRDDDEPSSQDLPSRPPIELGVPNAGRVADTLAGQIGQRQTRNGVSMTGRDPTARIDARIQNRVQSRIRNRVDRNYDPQANATSPFKIAGEQAQTRNRSGRR